MSLVAIVASFVTRIPARGRMSMDKCTFCDEDTAQSKLYVSLGPELDPHFHICSACYLVAIRHGYQVVYRTAA